MKINKTITFIFAIPFLFISTASLAENHAEKEDCILLSKADIQTLKTSKQQETFAKLNAQSKEKYDVIYQQKHLDTKSPTQSSELTDRILEDAILAD